MPLGIYMSVPFCKSKCSYCNFASDVFARDRMQKYADRLVADIGSAEGMAREAGADCDSAVDSIYLGGGTPSILEPGQIKQIFAALRQTFDVLPKAEITVECAPGTLSPAMVECLFDCGVNRASLGVQSFADQEARSVGRLHSREIVLQDLARLRAAKIFNINVDLIAGLPHQTAESWEFSLEEAVASGVPHVSVYMLEVDNDSRLGSELLAGGARYHAHFVPNDDLTADLYSRACECLGDAGIAQYEISNFARRGMQSRHNLKYWTRQPYLGIGVDAHSMLAAANSGGGASSHQAIRLAMPDALDNYLAAPSGSRLGDGIRRLPVSTTGAWEETFFLGLRLNCGIELKQVEKDFGPLPAAASEAIAELAELGLLEVSQGFLRLTSRGRLLSNEVFQRFISGSRESVLPAESPLVTISNRIQ